jgi:iodotyrosine deiodinase
MSSYVSVPYRPPVVPAEEGARNLEQDYEIARNRRSVRQFSPRDVPREMIENAIRIAGTAPSGAHRQPWHFVAIQNSEFKRQIRIKVEAEEREFYEKRATTEWLDALSPLGTDFVKDHITTAPWVVIVFRRDYDELPDGGRLKNYYMTESVGISVGFFIQALHRAGLATLTHTPAPMTFLRELCQRPLNEKPFVLIPIGYPADDCEVPDIKRKSLDQISEFI